MGGWSTAVGASEKLGGNYCRTRKHLDFPNKTQTVVCEEWVHAKDRLQQDIT